MNEREKKTVESLQDIVNDKELEKVTLYKLGIQDIEIASNLIEKQAKEIQNLKEIEKTHKEENGKLRVELEQEKEKNKDLEEKLKIAVAMLTKGTYPEKNEGDNDFNKKFIAVDKIRKIVDEHIPKQPNIITGEMEYTPNTNANSFLVQDILKLLEEK